MIDGDTLPTYEGERIRVRWLHAGDVPRLFEIFSDPVVTEFWSSPPMASPGDAELLLAEIHRLFHRRELFQWGIARRSDDQVIGTCTLASLDTDNRRAELGFALRSDHWRQGLMTEALAVLIDAAFTELGLHRLEADVDPGNARSIALLERVGFVREGYLRERWLTLGEPRDTVFLGLLAREWADRRAAR